MPRFLIEVPHPATPAECARSADLLMRTGSHFLTHADWGCMDGEHKAWIIVEGENKEEARRILPPAFRSQAKIVSLCKFSMEEIEDIVSKHRRDSRTEEPGNTVLKREAG